MRRYLLAVFLVLALLSPGFCQTKHNYALHKDEAEFDVRQYGAKGDGTACSSAIQSAISAMPASGGVLLFASGTFLLDSPVQINKTGVTLRGVGDHATQIKITTATCAFVVDTGYVNVYEGRFHMQNMGFVGASGIHAVVGSVSTGTGIILRNVYCGSIEKCTFDKLASAVVFISDASSENHYVSISNCVFRGPQYSVGVVGSGTNLSGIHIYDCWFNHSSLDFRDIDNSLVENCDFEPTTKVCYAGVKNTFRDNRFEQQNLHFAHTWWEVGTYTDMIDNHVHFGGGGSLANLSSATPIFKITGKNNTIDLGPYMYLHKDLIEIATGSGRNTIIHRARFEEMTNTNATFYRGGYNWIWDHGDGDDRWIFDTGNRRAEFVGGSAQFTGDVQEMGTYNNLLASTTYWSSQNLTIATGTGGVDYPRGFSAASDAMKFITLTVNATGPAATIWSLSYATPTTALTATYAVALTALVYVPVTMTNPPYVGPVLGYGETLLAKGRWQRVVVRMQSPPGEEIRPHLSWTVPTIGESMVIGAVSCVYGDVPAYIPNTATMTYYSAGRYP